MSYFLLDNPPASPQFYPSRSGTPTWAVSVHTSEGGGGSGTALALAGFISRRSDAGSYAVVVDDTSTIELVPPDYTTFSVAATGYNSRTYSVCISGRSADLSPSDPYTQACVDRLGEVIANLWRGVGVDPHVAARWVGTDALNTAGLFCHGDVQPWDRSDAWSRHPERGALDHMLIDAILRRFDTEEEDMKSVLVLDPSDGRTVWECWGLFRKHIASEHDRDVKVFLGSKYLDASTDAGFRKFCLDCTTEVK